MEEIFTQVIAGAPNLIVALVALLWLTRKMDRILDVLLTLLVDRIQSEHQPSSDPGGDPPPWN